MELTREQTIKACCITSNCKDCPLLDIKNCIDELNERMLRFFTEQNEPAPSANDTSSKKTILQDNNTSKNVICQGVNVSEHLISAILFVKDNFPYAEVTEARADVTFCRVDFKNNENNYSLMICRDEWKDRQEAGNGG